jgi:N-methylhydantoinase A/oxoprolinase/acetone carboxylase beta subunit
VYFRSGGWADTPVYTRDALLAGNVIAGPALIEEHASTTVVQPGDNCASTNSATCKSPSGATGHEHH